MQIIDGTEVSKKIKEKIKEEVKKLDLKPGLAVVLVGEDAASEVYVRKKHEACLDIGFNSLQHKLPEETSEEEVLKIVNNLNKDNEVHGILVQLPLPKHINKKTIINSINPEKDVDGFTPMNMGKLLARDTCFKPCTPSGIMKLLSYYDINLDGKEVIVLGRSIIVGKPMANMIMNTGGTVTVCHSKTKDIKLHTLRADIIISAVGKKDLITADMVKEGVVIIDVGMNKVDGKLHGDADFENLKDKCSFITPVPGGVGPMTIACLLENTLEAYKMMKK